MNPKNKIPPFIYSVIALPAKINMSDLFTFIDGKLPDPDSALDCSLHTFTRMIGTMNDGGSKFQNALLSSLAAY
mgnify:CR=1 FL=1